MDNMKKTYDCCLLDLRHNIVTLYEDYDPETSSMFFASADEVLLSVKVSINEHNNLVIEGEPLIFDFALDRTNINELTYKPCKRYIEKYVPNKFYRFFGAKPYEYVHGWWAYRSGESSKYILNNYKIRLN